MARKTRKTFQKIVFWINLFFVGMLFLGFFVDFIPPKRFPTIAVLSLSVPFLIIVNALFSAYWLILRKKKWLISFSILLLGYNEVGKFVQFFEKKSKEEESVSLMSFNARLFNHYNWHPDKSLKDSIKDFISAENPDILVVQEFYKDKKYHLDYPYKRIISKKKNDKVAHAVFSKFPIIDAGSLHFPSTSNNAIFTDIAVNQDTIRVYSLHLESLHISPKQEDLLSEDKEKMMQNIRKRFILQQEQTEIFRNHQKNNPYKTIVCGDFNNTAFSYIYRKIKGKNLNDAFVEAGSGLGKTFRFLFFPLRIDYILVDKSLKINHFRTFQKDLSDHYPIMVDFQL